MDQVRNNIPGVKLPVLLQAAIDNGIDLSERVFVSKQNTPTQVINAACVAEVFLDILTGSVRITRVDILQDIGLSSSPRLGMEQIEKAFKKSIGYWLTEQLTTDPQTGEILDPRRVYLQTPGYLDGPMELHINVVESDETKNELAVGNYSWILTWTVQPAVRYALLSARKDAGLTEEFLEMPTPCSPANILPLTGTVDDQMTLPGQ